MKYPKIAGWITVVAITLSVSSSALQAGSIRGTVADALGVGVPGTVMLYRNGALVVQTMSGQDGEYAFKDLEAGRYQIETAASGFEPTQLDSIFVGSEDNIEVDLLVWIGLLEHQITVTAAATALPIAQVGAPVSVLNRDFIERLGKPDILEAFRTVPGLSVVQSGARGGLTSIFMRGGEADSTKILIDGATANDIGGSFSYGALSTSAIEDVEVLRTANSVLYGADAMNGVISVQTRRGRTRLPELSYAVDGGNLGTIRNELSISQAVGRFDYFVSGYRFDTNNAIENNEYRNDTFTARTGVLLGNSTDINATLRRTETKLETPNAILYYGIPDDSSERLRQTYVTVESRSKLDLVTATLRYSYTGLDSLFQNPAPTGEPHDPFSFGFPDYLGDQVTLVGENGYSVTGRAILNYGFSPYPQEFRSNARRHMFSGQADVEVADGLGLSFGGRIEDEEGGASANRRNHGYFLEGRAHSNQRLFATGGLGIEDHAVFGTEVVPRLSLAFYAHRPTPGALGETKLMFTISKGIKAPSIVDDDSSLFSLLSRTSEGEALIRELDVQPIDAERTRVIDMGIEQVFWDRQARIRLSYFNNRNEDLIEYVGRSVLPELGVPRAVADATPFGATVNSAAFDAQGIELSGEARLGNSIRLSGWYMFLDAQVTKSFSGSALGPSFNPAFGGIPIGRYSPLVGGRPFRRPTHSGGLTLSYATGLFLVLLSGSFVGHQDDSTFLDDPFYGPSMLLPNQNLSGNYQKIDLSGSYQVHRNVKLYASVENLLNQDYVASAGFPGLGINAQTGMRFTVGGDRE